MLTFRLLYRSLHQSIQTVHFLKTVILSWLQNDGTRRFSKDQLNRKQLSPIFRPDALVVFRAKGHFSLEND